jgi:mannose-6-phosphate isomerase-like protein (cupin superfamily)
MSKAIGGLLVGLSVVTGSVADSGIGNMLQDFADTCPEVLSYDEELSVQLDISPPGEQWYVLVAPGGTPELHQGEHETPIMTLMMSSETLGRIHRGEMTAFTAGGKGSGADVAPLEIQFGAAAGELRDPKGTLLGFLQHFFARERPERIALGESHSRVVHGAHAIPMYYASGFRSAWYLVKEGQHLNEPGDTNPYPQAFVIISGRGRAKIGEYEVDVHAGESYYIPEDSDHVLWPAPGEALEVIWFAWGEGA